MKLLLHALIVAVSVAAWATPTGAVEACGSWLDRAPASVGRVELLSEQRINRRAGQTTEHLGGISGLDFDPEAGLWYLLSDDRSQHAPARLYPARFAFDGRAFGEITVQAPVALPLYPGEKTDPEALRMQPCTGLLAWASEGDGPLRQDPSVRLITRDGQPAGQLALPHNLRFEDAQRGARHNLTIEGLAFTPDGKALWVAMEGPLQQDGALASRERGALLRFSRIPLAGGAAMQHAYASDAIPRAASGGRGRADNGVSEILALRDGALLVVERSGREVAEGAYAFDIRLYEAAPQEAPDIAARAALTEGDVITPMPKRLLINLAQLGLPHIDNIEAAAWGPRLADGRATLVLVSDDNFAPGQVTQLIFLAIEERVAER